MDNVLIDDRRIHVDFSQSMHHLWRQFKVPVHPPPQNTRKLISNPKPQTLNTKPYLLALSRACAILSQSQTACQCQERESLAASCRHREVSSSLVHLPRSVSA